MLGIFIGLFLLGLFIQEVVLPFLIQLKNDIIAIFLNWIFDVIFSIVIITFFWLILHFYKRKQTRLRLERIENEKYWKQVREEEERKRVAMAYLLPKPKILPSFGDRTSIWKEEPEEQVSINVDLDKGFYKRKRLNKHEIEYLIEEGYKEFRYNSICTQKKENYLLKPRFNESLNHMIVIYDVAEYLDKKGISYEMFTTKMPDIVINFKRKNTAFEVETGTVMSNMKKFREKLKLLNKNYGDNWYFIVTNRNKIKQYKKYGKVIDPRYIKGQIDKIIKDAQK